MENTQVLNNELLNEALSSKEHIKDPHALASAALEDMLVLVAALKDNNTGLSDDELENELINKRRLLFSTVLDNLDELDEKLCKNGKELQSNGV